jgi:hypothetical protein
MSFRCPYCGYSKNYEYYLIRFAIYVVTTWSVYQFIDSKLQLTKKLIALGRKLF